MNNKAKLEFVKNLHKKNSSKLGFIPYPMIEKYIDNNQVYFEHEGGIESGYCIIGSGSGSVLKIYQHCIVEELRRLNHGKDLFKKISYDAQKKGYNFIQLRCRENLQANKFWKAIGFKNIFFEPKITQRTKKGINHWEYKIIDPKQHYFEWF